MILPLCGVMGYLHMQHERLKEISHNIEILASKAALLQRQKEEMIRRWDLVQKSPSRYLMQVVEALPLLAPEERRTRALAKQYPENRLIQGRLLFLQGEKNKIRFNEEIQRADLFFQERELALQHPVQMNGEDLKTFLHLIEDPLSPKPLLIFKSFDLKKEPADEPVYTVQAKLIERTP